VEKRLLCIPGILISNKTSGRSYLNSQNVGPKGPKAGGVIVSCFVLAWLSGSFLYWIVAAWSGVNLLTLFSTAYIMISAVTLFHSELKHKAGFNIPERFLDEPVEVRDVELADLPPV
jgi:hypothetical protein